ncbi:MAG: DUF1232 domain-containing protein [Alphaproteobacteria bacterium]|nr:DUF1232 domain-containing protein [Alphaproteobacteria bacterium]
MIRITHWRGWAGRLEEQALAIWIAAQDPRMPWSAQLMALLATAYAFSPIDLIPDAIPVLGLLDDLILVPLCLWLALKMTPPEVLADAHTEAARRLDEGVPVSRTAAVVIVGLWVLSAAGLVWWAWSAWG